jgi:hypothetical protein
MVSSTPSTRKEILVNRCVFVRLLPILVVAGCGVSTGSNLDPIDITGKLTMQGRAVSGVKLNLQAIEGGAHAILDVKNGEFRGSVTPGTYTFFVEGGSDIPEKYRLGAMDRRIEVRAGGPLALTLD